MIRSFIIDRIEGSFAVVELNDGTMVNIPKNKIVGEFKEGDILVEDSKFFKVDSELTKKRRKEIEHMMKDMWQ